MYKHVSSSFTEWYGHHWLGSQQQQHMQVAGSEMHYTREQLPLPEEQRILTCLVTGFCGRSFSMLVLNALLWLKSSQHLGGA